MPFPALDEAVGKLDNLRKQISDIFTEAGPDYDFTKVTSFKGTPREVAADVRRLNDEATVAGKDVDDLQAVAKAAERTKVAGVGHDEDGDGARSDGDPGGVPRQRKSIGQLFIESQAFKGKQGSIGPMATIDIRLADIETKTLMTTAAGWAPEIFRTGKVVDFATRPVQITDVVPSTTTTQAAIQYMEETTFTNSAAEVAEGGTYAESAIALTEQTSTVRKIGTFIPVTDEQLADVPQVQGLLDNRLPFMLRQRLDSQILNGNGTAPNLRGFLNVVGIQTQAKGTDPVPDAIYKGLVKVRVTGRAMPNAVLMHPTDWQNIRLLRTADGIYIWGNPSDAGPERIWGLGVVQTDAFSAAGTALVGDFANFTELSVRRGVEMQVSNSHSTFFIEGKQAVRADVRCALVAYRPVALCTVTGL